MSGLDALLAGIVADPHDPLRWLILADWLDDHDQPERAELLRLHRERIDFYCDPFALRGRRAIHSRVVELIDAGVTPVVPRHTLVLPGGVPLAGHFVPPGSFAMGGEVGTGERPVHPVTWTRGYFVGVHPVTQAQWVAVMGENPSHFRGDTLPVDGVSGDDATAFCGTGSAWLKCAVRLPTEAEWEYAGRAGTVTHFHSGDMADAGRMTGDGRQPWYSSARGESRQSTAAVGTFAANPWGLVDRHGNVWEWCEDWYDDGDYHRSPAADPACRDTEDRGVDPHAIRGGSYHVPPQHCRSACRTCGRPAAVSGDFSGAGFRVVFCPDETA